MATGSKSLVQEKKITFVISSLAGGGAEGVCVNVANGLADIGWDVTLVILHLNNAAYHDRVSSKVNLIVLGVNHARNSFIPLFCYLVKNKSYKIVAFNYELAVILQMLKTFTTLNYYLIARNINTFSKNHAQSGTFYQRFISRPLVSYFYNKIDHIINQCEDMKDDLLSIFPNLRNKTSVIYNPVNQLVEEYAHRADLASIEKQNYILCVGRLEKQKALHYAIQGFALVCENHPTLRLKIVGKGSLESDLKNLASNLNILNKIDFEGFQQDTIPYYLHAKATLLTSLYEGFPNVLIESITLGTPVIAFDCKCGPREIIQENVNGQLVEYANVKATAKAISWILNNPSEKKTVCGTSKKYQTSQIITDWQSILMSL